MKTYMLSLIQGVLLVAAILLQACAPAESTLSTTTSSEDGDTAILLATDEGPMLWHTLELDFVGVYTSETAPTNSLEWRRI